MSWLATETLTAQLPEDGQLRTASYSIRSVGDTLATQSSVTRGVVEALGPNVWQDSSSAHAISVLNSLCSELSTGSSAMYQAADALDGLAGYVAGQQWRYADTGQQLEELARDPLGDLSAHKLEEAGQLIEERRAIEQNVMSAMGHAASVVSAAAARASRYHGTSGKSFWSSLEHDASDVSDFATGIWDGTYDMGKGVVKTAWSLAVLGAKLSPERLLIDPQGYLHDAEHAARTIYSTVDYLAHNKKQFVSNLLNLDELRKNPIHWAGELVPTIVVTVLSFGAGGAAAKGAEVSDAIDATAGAADTAEAAQAASAVRSVMTPQAIEHITEGNIRETDVSGLHITPNGESPPGVRIVRQSPPDSQGIRQIWWQGQNSAGVWVPVPPDDAKFSTLFPNSWSKDEAVQAVAMAFKNSHRIGNSNTWQGTYRELTIKGFYDTNGLPKTGFPVYDKFNNINFRLRR